MDSPYLVLAATTGAAFTLITRATATASHHKRSESKWFEKKG
jgi:hypothetical protein